MRGKKWLLTMIMKHYSSHALQASLDLSLSRLYSFACLLPLVIRHHPSCLLHFLHLLASLCYLCVLFHGFLLIFFFPSSSLVSSLSIEHTLFPSPSQLMPRKYQYRAKDQNSKTGKLELRSLRTSPGGSSHVLPFRVSLAFVGLASSAVK